MKAQHVLFTLLLLAGFLMIEPVQLKAADEGNESLDRLTTNLNAAYALKNNGSAILGERPDNKIVLTYGITESSSEIHLPVCRDAVVAVVDPTDPKAGALLKHGLCLHQIPGLMNDKSVSSEAVGQCLRHLLKQESQVANMNSANDLGVRFVFFSEINNGMSDFVEGSRIVPIDRNGNGLLDDNELFYDSPEEFARAVWLGKYPKALSVNVILNATKADAESVAFINWIYNEAAIQFAGTGLMPLNKHEQVAALNQFQPELSPIAETTANAGISAWLVILLVTAGIIMVGLTIVFLFFRDRSQTSETHLDHDSTFGAESFHSPGGRVYDKSHTWAFLEEDGMVKIGLDDFIKHLFGTQPKLSLQVPGTSFTKGETMATIVHEGKKVRILSPVTGKIIAVNPDIYEGENQINATWLYKIEPENWKRELDFLYMAEPYREWLKTEFNRLKEFLVNASQSTTQLNAQPVMLDGGELVEGLMASAEPMVWEDFQQMFLKS